MPGVVWLVGGVSVAVMVVLLLEAGADMGVLECTSAPSAHDLIRH
jgi:hypothetical protein